MSYQLGSIEREEGGELYVDDPDREPRPRSHKLLVTAVALLVMGLFAGGLWFAYVQGLRHASGGSGGDVPLIRADERPTKVKPDRPGGMDVPDRDKLIYTQKRAAVEHLLPAPEKPLPRPTAPPTPTAQPEAAAPPSTSAVASTAPGAAPPAAGTAEAPPPPPAERPREQSAAPASAKPPTVAKTGETRLQLGSVRGEDAARQEWDRIKRTNRDLLGSLAATPIRADLGDKGVFYRIQTGPVGDAERICSELKRRNVGCIIVR